jgi:ubiquinone/menaquinone biosynthesis C-methylase UbiE
MNLYHQRIIEQQKYIWLSENNHLYGSTNHGKPFMEYILNQSRDPLIDIGCGRNNFTKLVKNHKPSLLTVGIDFAFQEADIICNANNIPLKSNFANTITSFDFFEHLLEEDIKLVLHEIIRIANNNCSFFATISNRDSINRGPNGETLHPTIKNSDWWLNTLNNNYLKVQLLSSGLYKGIISKNI